MSSHHEIIAAFSKRVEDWDYMLDRLGHRVVGAPDEVRELAGQKYKQLQRYRSDLEQKGTELKEASEQSLKDIEYSIEELWDTLKSLADDLKTELASEVDTEQP